MKIKVIKKLLPTNCYGINITPLKIKGIVIHYISAIYTNPDDPFNEQAIIKILKDHGYSYHFLIPRDGKLIQLVPLKYQAYHAGKSKFKTRTGCNKETVGIALFGGASSVIGATNRGFMIEQYATCAAIIRTIISMSDKFDYDYLVGHSDIATPKGRRKDPGRDFNWELLKSIMDDRFSILSVNRNELCIT